MKRVALSAPQTGSMIIEGMIAMLILTVGLIGIMGLEASMLANNGIAQQRIQAGLYANELIAMATADSSNVRCYTLPVSNQTGCSSSYASGLANSWVAKVTAGLPGANNTLPTATLASDGVTFTVTLNWKLIHEANVHQFISTTQIGG